jgi:hypothetical protein
VPPDTGASAVVVLPSHTVPVGVARAYSCHNAAVVDGYTLQHLASITNDTFDVAFIVPLAGATEPVLEHAGYRPKYHLSQLFRFPEPPLDSRIGPCSTIDRETLGAYPTAASGDGDRTLDSYLGRGRALQNAEVVEASGWRRRRIAGAKNGIETTFLGL